MHLNATGNYALYRSYRGAILYALSSQKGNMRPIQQISTSHIHHEFKLCLSLLSIHLI